MTNLSHVSSAQKHLQKSGISKYTWKDMIWRRTRSPTQNTQNTQSIPIYLADIVRKLLKVYFTWRATKKFIYVRIKLTKTKHFLVRSVKNLLQKLFIWEQFLKQTQLWLFWARSYVEYNVIMLHLVVHNVHFVQCFFILIEMKLCFHLLCTAPF